MAVYFITFSLCSQQSHLLPCFPHHTMAPPKGLHKAVTDPPAAPPAVDTDKPAKDQTLGDSHGNNDNESLTTSSDDADAGGSGQTMAERQSVRTHGSVEEVLLEDDSDDEMEVDHEKEAAMHFRTTVILLLPFVLAQEVVCVMDSVKMLMKRGWNVELSAQAWSTTKFHELQALYIVKIRYCRLQLSFLLERDAEICTSKEVVYQRLNGKLVKLHWQHSDNVAFVRERSLNPTALEVITHSVSATMEIGMLTDRLSTYKLQKSQRPAFLRCSSFHRVLHPVTSVDTDMVKGLVYPHAGDNDRWIHAVLHPADRSKKLLIHYPSLSCTLCGGQHYDKYHNLFTVEHHNNVGKWNLTLGKVHRLNATALLLPILRDPALALISTRSNREEWLCTQAGCKKAHGKCFMSAPDHIASAAHLICQEKLGTATKSSLKKTNLAVIKKDFGI
ncbi:unnamed protein product [Closterium sp. NIES-54]